MNDWFPSSASCSTGFHGQCLPLVLDFCTCQILSRTSSWGCGNIWGFWSFLGCRHHVVPFFLGQAFMLLKSCNTSSHSLDWDLAPVQTTRSELKSLSTSWNCVKVLMLWDITNAVARLSISTFLESVVPLRIENCHIWKRGFKWMSGQIWNLYYFEVLSSWFRSYFASFRLFNCTACFLFGQHLTF